MTATKHKNEAFDMGFDFEKNTNLNKVSSTKDMPSIDEARKGNKIANEINNSLGAVSTELRGLVEAQVPELKGVNISVMSGGDYIAMVDKINAKYPGAGTNVMRSLMYASDPRMINGNSYAEIATVEAKYAINKVSGQEKYQGLPNDKTTRLDSTVLQYSTHTDLADGAGAASTNGTSKGADPKKETNKKDDKKQEANAAPKDSGPVQGVSTAELDKAIKAFAPVKDARGIPSFVEVSGHPTHKMKKELIDQKNAQTVMAMDINGSLATIEALPLGELSKLSPEAQAAVKAFQETVAPKVKALDDASKRYEADLVARGEAEEKLEASIETKSKIELAEAKATRDAYKLAYEKMVAASGGGKVSDAEAKSLGEVKKLYDDADKALKEKADAQKKEADKLREDFEKVWNNQLDVSLGAVYAARKDLHTTLGPIERDANGMPVMNEYGHPQFKAYNDLLDKVFTGADSNARINYTAANWDGGPNVPVVTSEQAAFIAAPSTKEFLKIQKAYEAELDKQKGSVRPDIRAAIEGGKAYTGKTEDLTATEKQVVKMLDNLYKPYDLVMTDEKTRLQTTIHYASKLEAISSIYYSKLPHHMSRDKKITEDTMMLRDGMFAQQNPRVDGTRGYGGTSNYGPEVFNKILAGIPLDNDAKKEGWSLETMNKLFDSQFALTTGVGRNKSFGQNVQVAASPHKVAEVLVGIAAGYAISSLIRLAGSGLFGRRSGGGKSDPPNDE